MKTCSNCKVEKPLSEYAFKRRADGVVQSKCKPCYTAYNRKYYNTSDEQRDKQRKRIRAHKNRIKARYFVWKSKQKCSLCDESTPECLDLHHIDSTTKDKEIGRMLQDGSWSKLQREIDKCVVVCANCHRKIHAGHLQISARSITDNALAF